MSLVTLCSHLVGHVVTAPSGQRRRCMPQWLVPVNFFAPLLIPHVTQGSLCPDQAWLADFLAKEKEVAGVKDGPKEAEGKAAAAESTAAAAEKAEGAAAPRCFHHLKLALHAWRQLCSWDSLVLPCIKLSGEASTAPASLYPSSSAFLARRRRHVKRYQPLEAGSAMKSGGHFIRCCRGQACGGASEAPVADWISGVMPGSPGPVPHSAHGAHGRAPAPAVQRRLQVCPRVRPASGPERCTDASCCNCASLRRLTIRVHFSAPGQAPAPAVESKFQICSCARPAS